MSIKTKFLLYFLAVVFVPCALFVALGMIRGTVDVLVLLVCIVSVAVALMAAWFSSRSVSLPLEELTHVVDELAMGHTDATVAPRMYRATREYADLTTALSGTVTALRTSNTELRAQVDEVERILEETKRERSAAQEAAQRLQNVMIDRELRMIEMKKELHAAHKRLGEVPLPPFTPSVTDATSEQHYDDPEQARAAMLNLLEDLQQEKHMLTAEKAKDDAILRSMGDGIVVADSRGVINFLNENARVLLHLEGVDMSSDVWAQMPTIVDPVTNKPLTKEVFPLYLAVQGQSVKKHALQLEDSATPTGRYLDMTATPIMVGGRPLGGVATIRDVTKEREVDRAKTEFVSLASHQLRTPLSAINWYAEMLLAGDAGELNEEQRQYLDQVYQGNQRMVELINSLLNVSRLELGTLAVDPEDTDVIATAQSVLNELAPQVQERTINLTANLDPATPHLYADPKLLRMVFQNLASNAVKYTLPGGSVTITVEPVDDAIAISVADTGLGIPKSEQSKIFSKLFRATNARESDTDGTGLGLYIVRSVVEHSGGTIHFESEEGKGTTFFVRLPKRGMTKKSGTKSLS